MIDPTQSTKNTVRRRVHEYPDQTIVTYEFGIPDEHIHVDLADDTAIIVAENGSGEVQIEVPLDEVEATPEYAVNNGLVTFEFDHAN